MLQSKSCTGAACGTSSCVQIFMNLQITRIAKNGIMMKLGIGSKALLVSVAQTSFSGGKGSFIVGRYCNSLCYESKLDFETRYISEKIQLSGLHAFASSEILKQKTNV